MGTSDHTLLILNYYFLNTDIPFMDTHSATCLYVVCVKKTRASPGKENLSATVPILCAVTVPGKCVLQSTWIYELYQSLPEELSHRVAQLSAKLILLVEHKLCRKHLCTGHTT